MTALADLATIAPRYEPSGRQWAMRLLAYIPRMSRIKCLIGLAAGLLGPCSSGSNATCRLRRCESLTANPRALSSRNIAKKLGRRLRSCW